MFHPRGGTVNLHSENVNFLSLRLRLVVEFRGTTGLRMSELIPYTEARIVKVFRASLSE